MTGTVDATFELLVRRGLVSVVRADPNLVILSAKGSATRNVPVGTGLCEALVALFGMEDQIRALVAEPQSFLSVTNVSVRDHEGAPERLDYAVIYDDRGPEFVVTIMPSLANNDMALENERNLRTRMLLEQQIAEQARAITAANEALKRTNADLVNFTRIIAHDLKSPMRALRYSADDIEATLAPERAGGSTDALEELRTHARRMSQMVSDLLAYSRLEDKSHAAVAVDTRAMVTAIARSLPRPASLVVSIEGDWPQVVTIAALLDVVVRNLVDNAIKHHDSGDGEIMVSASRRADRLVIVVSDDGPGIPAAYRQAVLRPFVKIDKARSDGSGMGLSMVHKVVTDIGGVLSIAERPDGRRGTCVEVAWPLTNMAF